MTKFIWKFLSLTCICAVFMVAGATDIFAGSIIGTVEGDCDEGVTIEVKSDSVAMTETTDAGGDYTFPELADGVYDVIPSLEGYSFVAATTPTDLDISGDDEVRVDFSCEADCTPTCTDECGLSSDGCGGEIDCGECSGEDTCENNVCVPPVCIPECTDECGLSSDGCGGEIDCGECSGEDTCENNVCVPPVCIPECTDECGLSSDGCGGEIDCGECSGEDTCENNVCVPPVCIPECTDECGLSSDGCGGEIDCGECSGEDTCENNVCVPPVCVPETECSPESECGTEPDGCGGTIECGTCDDGEICVDNSCEEAPDIDCACDDDWKNHGQYVRCVAQAAGDLVDAGSMSEAEKDEIVMEAAESDCGSKK